LSLAAYYDHFGDAYMKVLRVRTERLASVAGIEATSAGMPPAQASAELPSIASRVADALAQTTAAIGWPILLLAVLGAWRLWRDGPRDRLWAVICAWGLVCLAFVVLGIASPVDAANQRFSSEFIGRVVYTTSPAAVLLAALGGVWAWRRGHVTRAAAAVFGLAAVALGASSWLAWIR
jgi:hypothetical protein